MSWQAETDQWQLAPGTVLSVYELTWAPGLKENLLPPGVSLAVRFPNGAVAAVQVIEVTASTAVIEMSNQGRWRMTQIARKEVPSAADTPQGVPTTYWIVKEPA